eukprot:jgi/Psemu1/6774/gm1.6774_g
MKFHPHILNWLPDNKPTQVYIRPFKDAIYYSLLSNQQLMREGNLSIPDYTTPLSPDNNPGLNAQSPEAWTTIYFHPDPEWESTRHSRHAS